MQGLGLGLGLGVDLWESRVVVLIKWAHVDLPLRCEDVKKFKMFKMSRCQDVKIMSTR